MCGQYIHTSTEYFTDWQWYHQAHCSEYVKPSYYTVCKRCTLSFIFSIAVPAPFVMIEEAAVPFNGTEFNLTCTVTVDKSVDTEVNISTQWLLPSGKENTGTISNVPERVSQLEQLHYLTFRLLRSEDSGVYRCNAIVRPMNGHFVKQNTASDDSLLVVRSKLIDSRQFLHVTICRATSSRCCNYYQFKHWPGQ